MLQLLMLENHFSTLGFKNTGPIFALESYYHLFEL